jgi:hypothetical protein
MGMCINGRKRYDKKIYDKKRCFDFNTSACSLRRIRTEFERLWKSGFFTDYGLSDNYVLNNEPAEFRRK